MTAKIIHAEDRFRPAARGQAELRTLLMRSLERLPDPPKGAA